MARFDFATKRLKLEFPNCSYTINVDSVVKARTEEVSQWACEKAKAFSGKENTNDIEKIFTDITSEVCEKIDILLGQKGASKEILGERLDIDATSTYFDAVDIMNFIIREIRASWQNSISERLGGKGTKK
ncbi:MAG: hypothetical protein IJ366_09385 [Clostridia bacterium]|nr:hypothetical protein [Clostridia bacterium]